MLVSAVTASVIALLTAATVGSWLPSMHMQHPMFLHRIAVLLERSGVLVILVVEVGSRLCRVLDASMVASKAGALACSDSKPCLGGWIPSHHLNARAV